MFKSCLTSFAIKCFILSQFQPYTQYTVRNNTKDPACSLQFLPVLTSCITIRLSQQEKWHWYSPLILFKFYQFYMYSFSYTQFYHMNRHMITTTTVKIWNSAITSRAPWLPFYNHTHLLTLWPNPPLPNPWKPQFCSPAL